jgi:hypothetical protein
MSRGGVCHQWQQPSEGWFSTMLSVVHISPSRLGKKRTMRLMLGEWYRPRS